MVRHAATIITAAFLALSGTSVGASAVVCTQPDEVNHTYRVDGDQGTYTWDDHGIARSLALRCNSQQDGSTTCHRWEDYGERGRSAVIFRMLPDGTLIDARSWALLDFSSVAVTPGFICKTQSIAVEHYQYRSSCPGEVYIHSEVSELSAVICQAVKKARNLTSPCGLRQTRPIETDVVSRMDEKHAACAAYFNCETDRLTVLTPSALSTSGDVLPIFNMLSSEVYFEYLIVHEITHAFVSHSIDQGLSRVPHEFLAHAIQIASLSERDRAAVMEQLTRADSADFGHLNETTLYLDTSGFALRSYQKFARPENGCGIIDRIENRDLTLPEAFRANSAKEFP